MVPTPRLVGFVEPSRSTIADDSAFDPDPLDLRMLRTKRMPEIELTLRSARLTDGDVLQRYVRTLSTQSRYNRFLGAVSELPPLELARTLAANGLDTLTVFDKGLSLCAIAG